MYISKFTDSFWGLVHLRCTDHIIDNKSLHEALRKCDKVLENESGVQLSIKARDKYKVAKVERGVVKPSGTEIEHIIPIRHRVKRILHMYLWEGWKDRKEMDIYIEKTFYAVYKLKKIEHDTQEYDAEELIMEQFRTNEKIKYFNEYTPKR